MTDPMLEFLDRYQHNPVLFVQECLGADPFPWQVQVLEAYGRGERRISVRSGHGVGKSACAAWITIHHLLTRYPQKTIVTAPSAPQLFDVLFAEIKSWITKLPPALQQLIEMTTDRIVLLAAPSDSFISARTSRADQPEAMAGVHSANVLLIGDEASGIPDPVFEAGAGSMSGFTATTLLLGNPVRSSGFFFDTHHKLADKWFTLQVSCEDNPNVSADYVADMARRYGERSNAYRVRVLGEFPLADDDTVIPYELVAGAVTRDVAPSPFVPEVWGVDVARFGDDRSALCRRKGNAVPEKIAHWRGLDTMQLVGEIQERYNALPSHERPAEILVDVIGIGAGVVDRLRELKLPARGINVSESPALGAKYRNLRAELWFKAREWLAKLDCVLPRDDELHQELVAVRYKYLPNGKVQIESKDDMRKRGVTSPDLADAFVLTFASDAATALYGTAAAGGWNTPLSRGRVALR